MPLVAAAVCPHPPMLVPEVASGAAPELDSLREACSLALRHLVDAGATSLVVVGSGDSGLAPAVATRPVRASFARFGVPVEFTVDHAVAVAPQPLPLSLLVAAWLVRGLDAAIEVSLHSVPADLAPASCARWRGERGGFRESQPWALLVMGDGSARRTEKAPGYFDPRAEAFDQTVAAALTAADPDALLAIDPLLATELWCAGRPAWQVLAGLVAADGRAWSGELAYDEAPYGVGYLVATLAPASAARIRDDGS